jgi:Pyridine nucleotide-disulphide oxidoreductase
LKYGLLVGSLVFIIFAIPVQEYVLGPEFARTIGNDTGGNGARTTTTTENSTEYDTSSPDITESSQPMVNMPSISASEQSNDIQVRAIMNSLIINLVFGVTLGLFSSLLSTKFGARYRCPKCDISFSRVDSLQRHLELIHGAKPILSKKVLILGGGFVGVEVLRRLQNRFQNDVSVDITMVSKDNFFLFTPMLHEVASGMIETRHIVTPIRAFCNRAKFYAAKVKRIDLNNKGVYIESSPFSSIVQVKISNNNNNFESLNKGSTNGAAAALLSNLHMNLLPYDYLVIAVGSETKFYSMTDIEKHTFTIKSWTDAIVIINHVIHQLEQAEVLLREQIKSPGYDDDNNN